MSQVRNLRAMFEGKGEGDSPNASPGPTSERRGRSPAGATSTTPTPGANPGEAPRPLSKVRTNFVAIEKDGRIGLQRNPSSDSNLSRNLSVPAARRTDSTSREPRSRTPRKMFGSPPITESSADPFDVAAVTDHPSTNPDKQTDVEETAPGLLPAEPKPDASNTDTNGQHVQTAGAGKEVSKPAAPTTKTTAPKQTTKPSAPKLSTARRTEASKGSVPTSTTGSKSSRPSDVLTRPTASSLSKKHEPLKTSQSATGFVKPKPKSPTKPVHLPSTLTAPTAASSSKGARASLSQSASAGVLGSQTSSRTSLPAAARPIKRQPAAATSTAGHGRPSIGPPPGKKSEPTHSKKGSSVDEGFLARMMRPTQASSSKTSDKAAVASPPAKKVAARSSISGAPHPATKAASAVSSQRSTQSRSPAQRATSQLSSEPEKDTSTPEQATASNTAVPSAEVEQPHETESTAEEPVVASDEPTQPQGVAEVIPEAIPETEATDEIVEETANVGTAEEAIDIAQEADLIQSPVEPEADPEPVSEDLAHHDPTTTEDDPEPAVEEIHAEEAPIDEVEVEAHAHEAAVTDEVDAEAQAHEEAPIDEVEVEVQAHKEAAHKDAVEAQETIATKTETAENGNVGDKQTTLDHKLTPATEEAIISPNESVSAEVDNQTVPIAERTSSKHESVDSTAADDLADLMAKSGLEPPTESTKPASEEDL